MINIVKTTDHTPKFNEEYFFDNNIWMFLFCPIARHAFGKQKEYSALLKKIKTSGNAIWINSLVLSEFSNAWLRIEYDKWKRSADPMRNDFKEHFVGSKNYTNAIIDIKSAIDSILSFCEKASDDFNALNIDLILNEYNKMDFNDCYYLTLAEKKKWNIVTDDSDFSLSAKRVTIITSR